MKADRKWVFGILLLGSAAIGCLAQSGLFLEIEKQQGRPRVVVSPPSEGVASHLGVRLQSSSDFRQWQNASPKVLFEQGRTAQWQQDLSGEGTAVFYRLSTQPWTVSFTTKPAEVLGYAAELDDAFAAVSNMSLDDFAQRYDHSDIYLPAVTWDISTAAYFTNFTLPPDPPVVSIMGRTIQLPDYSPTPEEMEFFRKNAFLVSERMATNSFARAYWGVYTRDLPVFVSSDSILHAWHRSYDAMLAQLEEGWLYGALDRLLRDLAAQVPDAMASYGQGPLAQSMKDADYFIAVGRSLLGGTNAPVSTDVQQKVTETLAAIASQQPAYFDLFGRMERNPGDPSNLVDFSLFKPRGHYTASPRLTRYFQAIIWCGHIDFRVGGDPILASPRELGSAIVLHDLICRANQLQLWRDMDVAVRKFVGPSDSLTLDQLDVFLPAAGVASPASIQTMDDLVSLQEKLGNTQLGVQLIQGHNYVAPMGDAQLKLPRSFTLLGQRFVPDSWVTSETVFDRVPMSQYGVRRIPSCLDVAFTVLGNDAVAPLLVERMRAASGVPYRDGVPYQTNLAALRMVFDTLEPEAVEDNLYNGWLAALRVLSKPTTAPNYPEAMRTRAWAMKTLNTQLASWTQLRHDTIAYVKQSVTTIGICSYPEGYVEPAPEFYCLMQHLSQKAADAVGLLHLQGITHIETNDVINFGGDVDLGQFKTNMVLFLNRFASTMGVLQGIALKELACQPLNEAETRFLRNVVQLGLGYLGVLEFNGWYPRLFYKSNEGMDWRLENYFYDPRTLQYVEGRPAHDSDVEDILVADVHTDPPDTLTPDPGAVLHEGVGRVYIMLIAVDSGPDRMVYAGPVFSHFEFLEPYGTRLNDGEWKDHVLAGDRPAHPEWTRDYLVPSGRP